MTTHFPHGLSAERGDGIFANLPTTLLPLRLYQDFYDFTLELDLPPAQSEWSLYGSGSAGYPGEPFGVIRISPQDDDTVGLVQDICQAVNFTLGSDLWTRFRIATPEEDTQVWVGMASADPNNGSGGGGSPPNYNDAWDQACMFHALNDDSIQLEMWVGTAGTVPVQTIVLPDVTMPRDGTYIELAYHYDGDGRIEIAVDAETVVSEAAPVVPQLTLHASMGARRTSGGTQVLDVDYYYSAQLRI